MVTITGYCWRLFSKSLSCHHCLHLPQEIMWPFARAVKKQVIKKMFAERPTCPLTILGSSSLMDSALLNFKRGRRRRRSRSRTSMLSEGHQSDTHSLTDGGGGTQMEEESRDDSRGVARTHLCWWHYLPCPSTPLLDILCHILQHIVRKRKKSDFNIYNPNIKFLEGPLVETLSTKTD